MKEGKTLSFIELFNEVDFIQIPILQRDYAQGREDATEVRRQFITSIKYALLKDSQNPPLDLDFVYGNFEHSTEAVFSVIDGQQRLTTLFLLHWYLAVKEGCLASFKETFVFETSSRFTYKTRVSAAEFFNALATADDVNVNDARGSISEIIVDKQWFFLSWLSDPTVKACLTMLDTMHQQFLDCKNTLYIRLTDEKDPRIIFQYLNLESFGISDELYIKMNARGKPLSNFENFKAWFCSQLEKRPNGKQIENKIDQKWTDIFWEMSRNLGGDFDKSYLRFFNLMAFYRTCELVEKSYDLLSDQQKLWLQALRTSDGYISVDDFERFKSFDDECLTRIEFVLDYFVNNAANDEVLSILANAVTNNDYVNLTKFYAFVIFIQSIHSTEDIRENLLRWNRVTNNLINNHRIDEFSNFIPSIRSLSELSTHCGDLYEFLAKSGMDTGFTKEQREEEALKAGLILNEPSWENLLIQFENHPYLQGKVGFLIEIATDKHVGAVNQRKFEIIARKAAVLLSDKILYSNEFLLERALLALDDYLVLDSGYRYSFCMPNRSTYRERSENWLKVVKKPVFKTLLSKIKADVEKSLKEIIENANCGDWRQLVVDNPEVIGYCSNRLVHKENNLIYLLSKSTFRGYHAELRTFVFEKYLKEMRENKSLPREIRDFKYVAVYGNDTPYITIDLNRGSYHIVYQHLENGEGEFIAYSDESDILPMPKVLQDLIAEIF